MLRPGAAGWSTGPRRPVARGPAGTPPEDRETRCSQALREYVQDRLAGTITRPMAGCAGPGCALDRTSARSPGGSALGQVVEPEQIAKRLRIDFPDDESMRVSHEAIYQALYVQGRGALRRELTACLRTGRALRVRRARTRGRGKKFVTAEIMISQRPAEAADRAVPGHWEGDLIVGLNSSAIGTLVERRPGSRCCCTCPRWKATGPAPGPRTAPRSPATAPRRSGTRSPPRSSPCPPSCAAR